MNVQQRIPYYNYAEIGHKSLTQLIVNSLLQDHITFISDSNF